MKTYMKVGLALLLILVLILPLVYFGVNRVRGGWGGFQSDARFYTHVQRPSIMLSRSAIASSQIAMSIPRSASRLVDGHLILARGSVAKEVTGDKFVFGGTFTLDEGDTLDGNLYVFGGFAALEEGSLVDGDVVLLGGTIEINGTVDGEIVAMGGLVSLGPSAIVEGDVSIVAGHIDRSPGAQVYGDVNTGIEGPVSITIPGGVRAPIPGGVNFPTIQINTNPLWEGLWVLFRSILWAAVAVLVVLFLPKNTQRIGEVAISQAPISGGLGLLTVVVAPIIFIIVAITIIGIPLSLLGVFLLFLSTAFGIIAVGTQVGQRLGRMLNQEWALAVAAGVGTFLLMLVVDGLSSAIPCSGGLAAFLLAVIGIGAVLLTRYGSRDYPSYEPSPAPASETEPVEIEAETEVGALPAGTQAEVQDENSEASPPEELPADDGDGEPPEDA